MGYCRVSEDDLIRRPNKRNPQRWNAEGGEVAERKGRSLMNNSTSPKLENSNHLQERNTWQLSDRMDWALGLKVRPNTKLVAICIARHANDKTGVAWPGMALLTKETGLSRSSVIRGIAELERGGHLTVTRLKIGKKNASNRYRLPRMGGAQVKPTPSVCETPPSVCEKPTPSVCETPEPVRTEPVKEPKQRATVPNQVQAKKSQSQKRHYCETHKRSWPGQYGEVCFLCDRESLKPKSGGDSFRDLMRRKGLITPEDDRAYDARQEAFRAKVFPRSDARTRKIDQERRARLSPA